VSERAHRNEASPPEIVGVHFRALLIRRCRKDILSLELEPSAMEEKERREKSIEEDTGFKQ